MKKKVKISLIIAACVLVVAAAVTVVLITRSARQKEDARRARTTIVGFYDVDGKQQAVIQELLQRTFDALPEVKAAAEAAAAANEAAAGSQDGALPSEVLSVLENAPVLEFVTLTDEQVEKSKFTEEIDVLITQTGALTTGLMTKSVAETAEIAARFPRTTQDSPYFSLDGQMFVMPLFLDHFETSYYTILLEEMSADLPYYLADFADYAQRIKEKIAYPVIAAGADDTVLFSMVSALVESVAGAEGYNQLVRDISEIADKGLSYDKVLELQLKGDAPDGIVFSDILQVFRNWRSDGIMLGNWYETQETTLRVFMEDYHTGIIEMMLSQHRKMPYPMIKYYESTQFPADTSMNRALIAPSVSCMLFTGKDSVRAFADALSSADEQENLSVATQLAPTTLRGQSFDIQADDVRFMAATSEGGPVPELGRAAFSSSEKRAEFADWLRKQLSRH